uniref:Uncharacterized protein n=1 Tax=Rhizophora mucronata TaxID=61149 RepID=A0A2P2QF60_RHIMU
MAILPTEIAIATDD